VASSGHSLVRLQSRGPKWDLPPVSGGYQKLRNEKQFANGFLSLRAVRLK
jgi:hypothetical protein